MISALGSAPMRFDTLRVEPGGAFGAAAAPAVPQPGAPDFASVLAGIAKDAVGTIKGAEATSIQGVNGQATTQSVVDAVMNAERTLQTAVTIRDKVVSAYLELSRMAI